MKSKKGGLGLDGLGNLSSLLKEDEKTSNGNPLNIDITLIDEDPEQPRTVFAKTTLKELAESIKLRGVKTPISVRATDGNRFMINHGARRFRASVLAKKTTIPAYIDLDYSKADQLIENIHRDNLTSREIAEYIGRQISAGQKKGEIAKEIGKSGSFVTQHHTLLNLPDELAELYNSGLCNDVTVIYEFAVAYKKNKDEVIEWIESNTGDWNRANVKLFKEYLSQRNIPENLDDNTTSQDSEGNRQLNLQFDGSTQTPENQDDVTGLDSEEHTNQDDVTGQDPEEHTNQDDVTGQDPEEHTNQDDVTGLDSEEHTNQDGVTGQDPEDQDSVLVNGVVIIEYKGEKGEILLNRVPSEVGRCWVELDSGIVDIKMSGAKFVSLIEG